MLIDVSVFQDFCHEVHGVLFRNARNNPKTPTESAHIPGRTSRHRKWIVLGWTVVTLLVDGNIVWASFDDRPRSSMTIEDALVTVASEHIPGGKLITGVGVLVKRNEVATSRHLVEFARVISVQDSKGRQHHVVGVVVDVIGENGVTILRLADSVETELTAHLSSNSSVALLPLGVVRTPYLPLSLDWKSVSDIKSETVRMSGRLYFRTLLPCDGSPVIDQAGNVLGIINQIIDGKRQIAWIAQMDSTNLESNSTTLDLESWNAQRKYYYAGLDVRKIRSIRNVKSTSTTWIGRDGPSMLLRREYHDRLGNTVKIEESSLPLCPTDTILYRYDSQSRPISYVRFNSLNGIIEQSSWTWFGDTLSIERKECPETKERYILIGYDSLGQIVRYIHTSKDGKVLSRTDVKCARESIRRNVVCSEVTSDSGGRQMSNKITTYDQWGRPTHCVTPRDSSTFGYDERGNKIKETRVILAGSLSYTTHTEIIYDFWGLPIEKHLQSSLSPSDRHTEKYTYEYFP